MNQNKESPARLTGSVHQRILEAVRVTPTAPALYGRRMSIAESSEEPAKDNNKT